MQKIIVLIVLIFLAEVSQSQSVANLDDLKTGRLKKYANQALQVGDKYSAYLFYKTYYNRKEKENPELAYKIARLAHDVRDYKPAFNFYKKALNGDSLTYADALFYMAQIKKVWGNYTEAAKDFESILNAKDKSLYQEIMPFVNNELLGCKNAQNFLDNPLSVEINHLGNNLNSVHIDYAPIQIGRDTLLFSSLKTNKEIFVHKDSLNTSLKRNIYFSKFTCDDCPGEVEIYDSVLVSSEYHTGNASMSFDKQRLYFTRCKVDDSGKMHCNIVVSKKVRGKWTNPVVLPENINVDGANTSFPHIFEDDEGNEYLLFASNKDGGIGGMDIWYCAYDKVADVYGNAVNPGMNVNSIKDEICPFYSVNDEALYFSSNGHPGMGGFDVFISFFDNKVFSESLNIGYPISSGYDDLHYYSDNKGIQGYFSSNRKKSLDYTHKHCCDDIYAFKMTPKALYVTGKVYKLDDNANKITREYIEENLLKRAKVALYRRSLKTGLAERIKTDTTDAEGNYKFEVERDRDYQLEVYVFTSGYFNKRRSFTTKGLAHNDSLIQIQPIGINVIPREPIVVDNIYYDYGKSDLNDEAKKSIDNVLLDYLLDNPNIIVEISSHTDAVSGAEFNLNLSQQRAIKVVEYLVSKGVKRSRLRAKGYGESMPVAPNTKPDGSDNPEGRKRNRRTEFKVLEVL